MSSIKFQTPAEQVSTSVSTPSGSTSSSANLGPFGPSSVNPGLVPSSDTSSVMPAHTPLQAPPIAFINVTAYVCTCKLEGSLQLSYPCQTPVLIPPQTWIFCPSCYPASASSIPPLVLACLYLVYLVFSCCAKLCTPLPYVCYISCLSVILTSHLHFLLTQYFTHLGLPLILW
ncbi:hypothetical protein ID866_11926 [Astraeus odoratus]|nr:hypothetical protein ID866_11926 [Astraeus odoratus]